MPYYNTIMYDFFNALSNIGIRYCTRHIFFTYSTPFCAIITNFSFRFNYDVT
ncbi:unnamed protein product [Schistosoma mattheei]|uniref:Uncharacterized protein n=1 Tax=Schistosoma mattheei TaxID=31246 RepID=A0A183PXD0_9TREM|nr:unnamed protein product [Schistosoma mattheei]